MAATWGLCVSLVVLLGAFLEDVTAFTRQAHIVSENGGKTLRHQDRSAVGLHSWNAAPDYPEDLKDFEAILAALRAGNYRIQAQLSTLNCGVLPPPHTYAVPLTYWLLHEDTAADGSKFQYITFSHSFFDGKTRMFDVNNGEIRQDGTVTFQARSYIPWDGEVHQTFTFECELDKGMIIYGVKMDRFSNRITDYQEIKDAIQQGSPLRGQYDGSCSGYLEELTAGGNVLASEIMNIGTENEFLKLHWSFIQAESSSLDVGPEVATYVADLEIFPDGILKTTTSLWDPHSSVSFWNASTVCNLTSLVMFTETEDPENRLFLDDFESIKQKLMNGHRLTLISRLPLEEASQTEWAYSTSKIPTHHEGGSSTNYQIRQRDMTPWTLRADGSKETIHFTFYRVTGDGKEVVEQYTLVSDGEVVIEDFLFDRLKPEATLAGYFTFTLGDGNVSAATKQTQLRAIQGYTIATLELGLLGRPATAVVNFTAECLNSQPSDFLAKGFDINERNYATVDGSPIQAAEEQVRMNKPHRTLSRRQTNVSLVRETTFAEITPDDTVVVTSNEVDSVEWAFVDGMEVTSVCTLHNGVAGGFFVFVPV